MPVCLKCCFKCFGRRVRPFDSGAVFPDYHSGSGYISPAAMCTHKMMTVPDTSINRAVYACIIRSITRSSLLLIEQTVITAIMMKNSAIATSSEIINPFILKNGLIGLWNSSGAVRPHRVKR